MTDEPADKTPEKSTDSAGNPSNPGQHDVAPREVPSAPGITSSGNGTTQDNTAKRGTVEEPSVASPVEESVDDGVEPAAIDQLLDPVEESSPLGSLAIIRRMVLPPGHGQRLVISPLVHKRQIGSTTVDLRLGTEWEAMRSYRFGALDPGADQATATEQLQAGVDEFRLTAGQRHGVVLHPGELLLALTLEYLHLPHDLWGQLEGRSTWARQGLQVHATAGMVDGGFKGYLTLELQNTGRIPLVLYPGLRVAQMAFFPIFSTTYAYSSKPSAGYSGQSRARSRFVSEPEHAYRNAYVTKEIAEEAARLERAEQSDPSAQGTELFAQQQIPQEAHHETPDDDLGDGGQGDPETVAGDDGAS